MAEEKAERRNKSIVKKFTTAFAVLYIIPMLVSLYLLLTLLDLKGKTLQIALLFFFCLLLGMAGHLILRAIVKSLVKTVENVEAVAGGDLSRRAGPDSHDELQGFAKNFNRITENLQKNIEDLEKSKNQIQTLLTHISKAVASPLEIEKLLGVYLSSITSIIGYKRGIVTLVTGSGEFEILSSVGLPGNDRRSFLNKSEDLLRRVVDSGTPLTVCDGTGDEEGGEALKKLEIDGDSSVSVPLVKSHKVIGVLTLAAGRGTGGGEEGEENAPVSRKVGGDDIVMLQNLAAQMATAIENSQLRRDMEKTYFESISALAAAVEARDIYTNGHSHRVSNFSVAIAKVMGLSDEVVKLVNDASLLHDIGKIGIPDTILHNSSAKLPDELYEVIKTHSAIGENIVKPLHSLRTLCPGVRHHHERVDGNGYPDGLTGQDIPIEARIMAVADAYDAMTSDRPYRNKMSHSLAIQQLQKNSGSQFDPQCVSAMLRHLGENPPVLSREMLKEKEFSG